MVRSASVAQQSHLETYLRGTVKRSAEPSPLDLSSSVAAKKQKKEDEKRRKEVQKQRKEDERQSREEETHKEGHNERCDKAAKPSFPESETSILTTMARNVPPDASPERASNGGLGEDRECLSLERVLHWSVEDVCEFVRSVDLCAEYVEVSRNFIHFRRIYLDLYLNINIMRFIQIHI